MLSQTWESVGDAGSVLTQELAARQWATHVQVKYNFSHKSLPKKGV